MNFKFSEKMTAVPPGVWFPAEKAERFLGLAWCNIEQGGQDIVCTLNKATDASGTNSTLFETKTVTRPGTSPDHATLIGYVDGKGADMGLHASGAQFTHVSLAISGSHASPADVQGLLVIGDLRYTTDALNHGNAAPTT